MTHIKCNLTVDRGGVSLETEKGKSFTKSMLVITRALLNDSGNYTCFSNKAAPASVVVHVLNGKMDFSLSTKNFFYFRSRR